MRKKKIMRKKMNKKQKEILSPEKSEELNENNNTKDLENSDIDSELSDYNLQDLFQENIIFNMGATEAEIRRVMERALGLTANALDNPLAAGETIRERIENAGNE